MSARLRAGIVGIGRMGRLYARIVQEADGVDLVAVVGNTPERTAEAGAMLGVPAYPGGAVETMWQRHPDIDVAIIATPEWEHLQPTLVALEHRAHVLLEKPLAHDLGEARAIVAAAKAATSVVMLCHPLRFDPRFALARDAVAAGEIGDVRYLYARRHGDQQAARRILGRCHPAYWLTPHDVDIMRWMTGTDVQSVCAHAARDGEQPDDGLFVDLRFDSGALGRVENAWTTPAVTGRRRWGIFDVLGNAGSIEISPYEQGLVIRRRDGTCDAPDTHEAPLLHGTVFGTFAAMVHHFFDAIRGVHRPLVQIGDGLATIEVAAAIQRSLTERREVRLDEL